MNEFDWWDRARPWVLGAVFTVFVCGVARFALIAKEKGIREQCTQCKGTGIDAQSTATPPAPCAFCEGSGYFWTFDDRFLRAGPSFVADLAIVAAVAVVLGLVTGLRRGICPGCLGQGYVLEEIQRPGRDPFVRRPICSACEGSGLATALDRWLAGF